MMSRKTRPATRDEKIANPGIYEVPVFDCPRCGHCCPERHWVGLTDEEIDKFMPYCHTDQDLSDFRTFAFEIEAKLKEKNAS
jgi:hypothetical protein